MGWTFSREWKTKKDLIKSQTEELRWYDGDGYIKPLKIKTVRNGAWVLYEYKRGDNPIEKRIVFYLIEKHDGEYGYKDMSAKSHPYYYDCPVAWLNETDDKGDMYQEWASIVRRESDKNKKEYVDFENADGQWKTFMPLKTIESRDATLKVLFREWKKAHYFPTKTEWITISFNKGIYQLLVEVTVSGYKVSVRAKALEKANLSPVAVG